MDRWLEHENWPTSCVTNKVYRPATVLAAIERPSSCQRLCQNEASLIFCHRGEKSQRFVLATALCWSCSRVSSLSMHGS